jgi:23S rRNA (guanosine2251-2'-O)-methyltransferase
MAIVYGVNPVLESLNTEPERIESILLLKGPLHGQLGRVARLARQRNIRISFLDRKTLSRKADSTSHQGVIAFLSDFRYSTLNDLIIAGGSQQRIVMLDGVQDPHNLGAIIRTSVCAGVQGVIIPDRNSANVNATVVKTSAGATSKAAVAQVRNLAQTVEQLQAEGFWAVAIDASGSETIAEIDSSRNLLLVFGNEHKGIRRLVREKCDHTARIPMKGDFDSLNVSVAVGVTLFRLIT